MRTPQKLRHVAVFALGVAVLAGGSTFALARRKPSPPPLAPTAAFASARLAHPRPIPLSKPDASPGQIRADAGASAPQPIHNVAELDRYLDGQLLYVQYDPSVAGDVAEEAVALMNSLVDELGGLDSALEKEQAFTAKLDKLAETPPTRPAVDPPDMKRLLSEMRGTTDGAAQAALLSEYLDEASRAPAGERGYWFEQLKKANIEDHRAPAPAGIPTAAP